MWYLVGIYVVVVYGVSMDDPKVLVKLAIVPRQRRQKSLLAFLSLLNKSASARKHVVAFHPRVFQGIEIHEERGVTQRRKVGTNNETSNCRDKRQRIAGSLL